MNSKPKESIDIVIFTGDLGYTTCKNISEILKIDSSIIIHIYFHKNKMNFKKFIKNQLKNIRKNGIYRFLDIAKELLKKIKVGTNFDSNFVNENLKDYKKIVSEDERVKFNCFDNINSREAIKNLQLISPILGVSIASPILSAELLQVAKNGNINLHKGKLPEYRGMPPAFWELKNNDTTVYIFSHFFNYIF